MQNIQVTQKPLIDQASRQLEICNACRYCEGLCPVFPEITKHRTFQLNTINYLSNLCHNCKGCFHGCQYAPPHEFNINIPQVFAQVRSQSYAQYTFPTFLTIWLNKKSLLKTMLLSIIIGLLFLLPALLANPEKIFAIYSGEGAFFKVIPFWLMSGLPTLINLYVLGILLLGFKRFWQESEQSFHGLLQPQVWTQTFSDIFTLRHLGGGKSQPGCTHTNEKRSQLRRWFHHLVFYGFLANLCSTTIAAIYHHVFGWISPYAFDSLPVIMGTTGGVAMIIGVIGLFFIKIISDPRPNAANLLNMEQAFLALLFWINVTGLLLLFFRDTIWMVTLLSIHLGFVFTFFLVLPYSKFVHSWYRLAALLKYNLNKNKT